MNFIIIKRYILISALLCTSSFYYSCNTKSADEIQNVNAVVYKLVEADNNSDIQSVLNSYTDSIEFYPAGREFTKGIKNVQTSYEKLFKENKLFITTRIFETSVFGDKAIITGLNKGTRKGITDLFVNQIDDKYIAILVRNQKGEWKIDKLIWGLNH